MGFRSAVVSTVLFFFFFCHLVRSLRRFPGVIGVKTCAAILCLSLALLPVAAVGQASGPGVLLLAHGGAAEWNDHVKALAQQVDQSLPTEIAFGMASCGSMQAAIDRLGTRGVTQIVAVPLFVSSYSSVITSTEYLLGLRHEAPPELEIFAKMDHSSHGAAGSNDHTAHGAADPTTPVASALPVQMTTALNRHVLIGQIAADRAKSISNRPENEAVILVAHGPVPDDDNQRWLADMAVLAEQVRGRPLCVGRLHDGPRRRGCQSEGGGDCGSPEQGRASDCGWQESSHRAAPAVVRRHRERASQAPRGLGLRDGRSGVDAGRANRSVGAGAGEVSAH